MEWATTIAVSDRVVVGDEIVVEHSMVQRRHDVAGVENRHENTGPNACRQGRWAMEWPTTMASDHGAIHDYHVGPWNGPRLWRLGGDDLDGRGESEGGGLPVQFGFAFPTARVETDKPISVEDGNDDAKRRELVRHSVW